MTVGICILGGKSEDNLGPLEAIVIADAQISGGMFGRQSNSVQKIGLFEYDGYHGAIFGSGNGNMINGVLYRLDEKESLSRLSLDDYADSLRKKLTDQVEDYLKQRRNDKLQRIMADAELVHDVKPDDGSPSQRERYVQSMISKFMNEDYEQLADSLRRTEFFLVGYDCEQDKIRVIYFSGIDKYELFFNHAEIGSGLDGAHMNLATNLQGARSDEMGGSDLLFRALNGYAQSTTNSGVGGAPTIVHINPEGNRMFTQIESTVLNNIAGAYAARIPDNELSRRDAQAMVGQVFEGKADYAMIAEKVLGDLTSVLTGLAIPLGAFVAAGNNTQYRESRKELSEPLK